MNIYPNILDGLLLLLTAVLIRHSLYRYRFFLHMFQQVGYKTNEYWSWIRNHFNSRIIRAEHLLYMLAIILFTYYLSARLTLTSSTLIMTVFGFFLFFSISTYRQNKEKKPLVFTNRMKRLAGIYILLLIPLWYAAIEFSFFALQLRNFTQPFVRTDPFFLAFGLVFIDILIPFLLFVAALIVKPVETYIQYGFKKQARKKLASMPDLKIIAITGSYGKTSTKFMVRDLINERYRVCTTPGSYNTPMGVCKVVNNDLKSTDQVLILEMGARYQGNIQELCNIATPDIAIVTNIGVAHLETFGSQNAIAKEKSTIVQNLKKGGIAILNADDPLASQMGKNRTDIKQIMAGIHQGDFQAVSIRYGIDGMSFQIKSQAGEQSFKTQLLGEHNVQNMVLAIATASILDIRLRTMAIAAEKTEPVEHRLELKEQNGIFIIDDAFNSNPVGAKNAVDILSRFDTGRRIIITPGMIELGKIEEQENRTFGRHIAEAKIDLAILVGEERTRPISEGIRQYTNGKRPEVKIASSLFEANDIVKKYARKGDVILYENDLPDTYNETT